MSKYFIVLLSLLFLLVKSVKYDGIDVSEHQEVIDFQKAKKIDNWEKNIDINYQIMCSRE